MSGQTAGLSIDEFERLQTQLLDLKAHNYHLVEQNNKKDAEIQFLCQKSKTLEDDVQRANVTIAKSKRAKDITSLENETELLKHKLAVQEEEFRLQQSTLLNELNRLVSQNDSLEKEKCAVVQHIEQQQLNDDDPSSVEFSRLKAELASVRTKFEDSEEMCKKLMLEKGVTSVENGVSENEHDASVKKNLLLEKENADLKNYNSSLKVSADENKLLQEKLRQQNEEHRTKLTYFQQQLAEINEKLRKKQESYQMLSDEKERQYTEFKKSLDNMIRKKDTEISSLVDEVHHLKKTFEKMKGDEEMRLTQKESTQSLFDRTCSQLNDAVEQNEALQIQLQESHSANDCLSSQLQEAREDVTRMQKQVNESVELSNKRKELVDEMAKHLEKLKDEYKIEQEHLQKRFDETVSTLNAEIEHLKNQSGHISTMNDEILRLNGTILSKDQEVENLNGQIKSCQTQLELSQIQHEEFLSVQKLDSEKLQNELQENFELAKKNLEHKIEALSVANLSLSESMESCRQAVKDKDEELKVLEKKQISVLKDLKKQAQTEKKRADRLQEKLQEVLNESTRNKSPGFEEVRASDLKEPKVNGSSGDNGSVSSWSVVSGNNHHKETDRHSNAGDQDSVSSMTMLETDNQELITRVAMLQKKNFELEEKIHFLEESSAAMADDLVNKASVIEQFLKEKPIIPQQPPGSPDKLQIGLKKMMDLVKIDQTAGEIRDMNKRLQLMLEETLTKNMHLQRDLEVMSQEVARLSGGIGYKKITT